MKKLAIILIVSLYATSGFGQLKVSSDGNVEISNSLNINEDVTVTGTTGLPGRGVFCVSSSHTDPNWGPSTVGLQSLITAQSKELEYPFVNYHNGIPNFYVSYNGIIYTRYGVVQTSDSSRKKNIMPLSSTLNKIHALNGVSFNYKEEKIDTENNSDTTQASFLLSHQQTTDIQQQIEQEKSRKRIGLIAQEVEKIYPEVVRTQIDGTKGILYSDLVAVLIEGIKELSTQVETLQQQVEELQNGKSEQSPKQEKTKKSSSMKQSSKLYQNTPNPFNQETEIAYRIPNDVNATICIYNLSGQQLKKYPLYDTIGKIIVSASEFPAGIYIYSLIINNQEIDSKRMILTD